ncbi:PREDICTED: protein AKNAD1-like [Thamnophis sirtalis]|uniref:Protein AKNAD1-like n=1 Tax=Thamnophis sirtalis TaxID=35019 RepID=A0A6I9YE57_9SAUR|nr:PREDICTED: protein AKNAD1-like [Thamnophis sirtalis]
MLYSEDNTDNEQEDLPYDGDLQHRDQCSCDSQNLEEFISVKYVSPTVSTLTSSISNLSNENPDCQKQLSQRKVNAVLLTNKNDVEFAMTSGKEIQFGGFTSSGRNEEFSNSKMSDVLLRHFPTEDLADQLIDSETIPEISFTDSFDETVLIKNKSSENTGIFPPKEEMKNTERKVLTRQAEVQNHIDHLRFNSPKQVVALKNFPFFINRFKFLFVESRSKNITSSLPLVDAIRQPSASTPFLQNITDETEQILKKQTEELKANVEIFSECIKQNVFSVQEHFQFLQLLKEQLEQLEHNYVATREKHYALQLQNHKHSSRTIGKFDANRKVEGEIFKLGMFLDDIKEKIEKTFASYSSTYITSPSLTSPPSSICSSYSASPLITSTNEPPKRNIAGLNIPQNENCWKKKNHPVEGTPQKAYKKSIQGDHPSQQIPLELQKKNIHLKTMSSGDKARQQTNRHILIKEFDQYPRSHKTKQNYNNEQENTDR